MTLRLIFELVAGVVLLAMALELWRTRHQHKFSGVKNVAEAVFHISAALAIVLSGAWIIAQRDWAPRAAVDVRTSLTLVSTKPEATALLQVAASMHNQGRLPYSFKDVRIAIRGYDLAHAANKDGDLAQRRLGSYPNPHFFNVGPGETEVAYGEFYVPCSERAVQVLVKIGDPAHEKLSYERKVVVQLSAVCTSTTA